MKNIIEITGGFICEEKIIYDKETHGEYLEGYDVQGGRWGSVMLTNGTVIESYGGGSYCDANGKEYGVVMDCEYDEDGEFIQGDILGYICLD